jgi:hypothetical protein
MSHNIHTLSRKFKYKINWFNHLERMDESRFIKNILPVYTDGGSARCGPDKRLKDHFRFKSWSWDSSIKLIVLDVDDAAADGEH